MESIEARLNKIENQTRQLKVLSFILLVVFAGGIFWISRIHMQTAGILTGHQFLLVDDDGRARGGLALGPDGPFLSLRDAVGKERLLVGLGNGPHLTLRDSGEVGRIVLGVVSTGPGLMMYDDQGQARAQLDVGKNGPRLYFENQFGYQATVGNYFVPGNEDLNQKLRAMAFDLSHNTLGVIWRAP